MATITLHGLQRVDRPELAVEPGQQVSAQLRVRNNGSVVDQFTFEGLGAGAAWIEAATGSAVAVPRRRGHRHDPLPPTVFAEHRPGSDSLIRRQRDASGEDPMGSVVEEGVITVGRFADRSVEIYPLTARGRRKGQFEIAVDNRGNAPIEVEFSGADPENACRYEFSSQALVVEPGTAHFTKFDVIPHERFWKGPPKTHQFQILVTERARASELPAPQMAGPPGTPPPPAPTVPVPVTPVPEAVNGTLLQEAMVPPWLIKAIIALIALILLAVDPVDHAVQAHGPVCCQGRRRRAGLLASLNDKVDALTTTTLAGVGIDKSP